jgi:uncharacterized RDD family membrane protein YckC
MQSQYDPPQIRTPGARCAVHVEDPAISICSRCGAYLCVPCSHLGPEGQDYCQACVAKVAVPALATRNSRLLAQLLDSLVVSLPVFVTMIIYLFFMLGEGAEADTRGLIGGLLFSLAFLMTLGVLGYQAYQTTRTGQSIGKRMMGIRVVRGDGSRADFVRVVLLRNVVPYLINVGCGLFGLIDTLFIFSEEQRCIHDHIADTRVVKVGAKEPPFAG